MCQGLMRIATDGTSLLSQIATEAHASRKRIFDRDGDGVGVS
jgi:hypothetical protein